MESLVAVGWKKGKRSIRTFFALCDTMRSHHTYPFTYAKHDPSINLLIPPFSCLPQTTRTVVSLQKLSFLCCSVGCCCCFLLIFGAAWVAQFLSGGARATQSHVFFVSGELGDTGVFFFPWAYFPPWLSCHSGSIHLTFRFFITGPHLLIFDTFYVVP